MYVKHKEKRKMLVGNEVEGYFKENLGRKGARNLGGVADVWLTIIVPTHRLSTILCTCMYCCHLWTFFVSFGLFIAD